MSTTEITKTTKRSKRSKPTTRTKRAPLCAVRDDEPAHSPKRLRTFRCDDELWTAAQQIAAQRDDNLSEILRGSLSRYVRRHSA